MGLQGFIFTLSAEEENWGKNHQIISGTNRRNRAIGLQKVLLLYIHLLKRNDFEKAKKLSY